MPRIKLRELRISPFAKVLEVRVGDLNYGSHLSFESLLGLAHQAWVEVFADLGVEELDLGDGKTGIVVSDVAIQYLKEVSLHDRLCFEIAPFEVGRSTFRLAQKVKDQATHQPVARIEISFAAFDYETKRSGRLPDNFRRALLSSLGDCDDPFDPNASAKRR
ncbi:MAG: thioesterase family protein [Myxococcota bacterium]|nr:thioesterase family protein [Myxococcota bacterium]